MDFFIRSQRGPPPDRSSGFQKPPNPDAMGIKPIFFFAAGMLAAACLLATPGPSPGTEKVSRYLPLQSNQPQRFLRMGIRQP